MRTDLIKALDEGTAPWKEIEYRSKDFWVFKDGYPVTEGHLLIVPTMIKGDQLWECYKAAYKFGFDGITAGRWEEFNVGQNVGAAAGQTVMYPHVHMIHRRNGDSVNPRGGVRNVIPGKADYAD